ncbi:polysaccharide biosynthesis C-terminal domain-containing protein [Candidatus Nitrosotalea okcheonensis]|uniref:Membrane protein (Modular protein) n=1 Tax=Candidatus Nitrosotalea okcheonensis TaxID=1903276 RepID=A0A2H1FHP5_9ARCH|nr:polysaccharide biosynthesis C-terminal domain-containing protein [Candidatus Nitrosotalea okcheonensis]SMH72283.1 Putative membrane protein (modular protein) [Candidatus Nitrosotalea okcheonensis]
MKDDLNKIRSIVTRFKDLTTLGIANIASAGISGIFWFYLASILGTSEYGRLSYLISIGSIAGVISFLGAGTTITVYSAKNEKIQATLFSIITITSAIGSIVTFLIFHDYTVSLYIIGYGIFNVTVADILGKKQYKNYSIYMITQKILWVGLSLLFYYIIGFEGIILGIAFSFLAYSFVIIRGLKETKFSLSMLKSHFRIMMNNYVLDLSRAFGGNMDKLIIAPLLGFSLLGNYQLGQQFLSLLSLLPTVVFQYILPHDSSGNANKKLKKSLILFSIGLAVIGIIASPIIIPHLFPKYTQAVRIFQIISLAVIPASINLTYISQFLGREQSKIVLIGSGISLAVAIPSIIILGKIYGINGATFAIVLSGFIETAYLVYVDRLINRKSQAENISKQTQNISLEDHSEVQETKIFSLKHIILSIVIIFSAGLFLRIYYFPYNIPLILDALQYFSYASDATVLGHLPTSYIFANNGWPAFLSLFFSLSHFSNVLDYMNLQRVLTVSLSVLTIIPVYLLCRRFFSPVYAIIGAAIFAFEPRIIQNSELGITEPLFIILVTLALFFFFSSRKNLVYVSFALVAFSTLVRAEGFFVFLPFLIMFFVRNRKGKKIILNCLLVISIFILLILPMVVYRIHTTGNDAITGRILASTGDLRTQIQENGFKSYLQSSTENILKLSGWSLIPMFILILPPGLYFILRERNLDNISIITIAVFMSLPVLYAFSANPDTRYIYPLFPLFCVISLFTIKKIVNHQKNKNVILFLVIGSIIVSSIIFLDLKKIDYDHQEESFMIAQKVTTIAKGVNDYHPEDAYITPASLPEKWPVLESSIDFKTITIPTKNFTSLTEYIKFGKGKGLTDLVVDGAKNRPAFLNDVYYHDNKYPFLTKIFDSYNEKFKYHLKIYEINYEKLNSEIIK